MNKIKYIVIFVVALMVISFIILAIMGASAVNNEQVAYIEQIMRNFTINKEYVQEKDISITNRELYLNYDNDEFDNNNELLEATSIYYWDTDGDGVSDNKEIDFNISPLKQDSFDGLKDNVRVYYFGTERFEQSQLSNENLSINNVDLGIEITNIDLNSKVSGIILKETGSYLNKNSEVSFLVKEVNAGANITLQVNSKNPIVIGINPVTEEKTKIDFSISGNRITFTHNGKDIVYIIGEKDKLEELVQKEFLIFKSNIPLFKNFYIYETTNKITGEDVSFVKPEEIKIPEELKLKTKQTGLISSFIFESLGNNFYGEIDRDSMLVYHNYKTSLYDLKKMLNLEPETFVTEHAFNINNFSTSLIRQNVGAGLAYGLTLFNKEINSSAKHVWDTQSSIGLTTEYDFRRDLNGYKPILNNNIGKYKFSTKLVERQDLDKTSNPDLQVLKFIEMYNDIYEKNKKKYLITNKYSTENIDIIEQNIINGNLPMFGLKTVNGGIYLTGYKIEKSEFSDNVYKVYVYDPNFKQNMVNGKDVSGDLILYLIKTPKYEILGKNNKVLNYSLQYYYNPFNMAEYSFNNIDNKKSDLDIFIF